MQRKINLVFKILFVLILCFMNLTFAQSKDIYKVIKDIKGNAQKSSEKNIIKYKILKNDTEIYSINIQIDYDVPVPAVKVFENGSCVLINAFNATLTFYDDNGSQISKSNILKNEAVNYERSVYSDISEDMLVVSVVQPDKENATIQFYDNFGRMLNQWQLSEKFINGINYSKQNGVLAISAYQWLQDIPDQYTLFLQNDGNEISRIPYNFKKGKFLENKNIYLGYSNKTCFVYDLTADKILYQQNVDKKKMILLADYFEHQVYIIEVESPYLEKGKWYYQNPIISEVKTTDNSIPVLKRLKTDPFTEYALVKNETHIILKMENEEITIR